MGVKLKNDDKQKNHAYSPAWLIVPLLGVIVFIPVAVVLLFDYAVFAPHIEQSCETMYDEGTGIRIETWSEGYGAFARHVWLTQDGARRWSLVERFQDGAQFYAPRCDRVLFVSDHAFIMAAHGWDAQDYNFMYTAESFSMPEQQWSLPDNNTVCHINSVTTSGARGELFLACKGAPDRKFFTDDTGFTWWAFG